MYDLHFQGIKILKRLWRQFSNRINIFSNRINVFFEYY